MIIKSIPVGELATNCYLLGDEVTKAAILIDPGAEPEKINALVQESDLNVTKILITHGHFDHLGAVAALSKMYHCPYLAFKARGAFSDYLTDPKLNLSLHFPPLIKLTKAIYLPNHAKIALNQDAPPLLELIATPGHSADSVIYYSAKLNLAFVGDTCFKDALGRTDLPGGSAAQLKNSIEQLITKMPNGTKLLPGHGPATTALELKNWLRF